MECEFVQDGVSLDLLNNELNNYMTGSAIIKKIAASELLRELSVFLLRMKNKIKFNLL